MCALLIQLYGLRFLQVLVVLSVYSQTSIGYFSYIKEIPDAKFLVNERENNKSVILCSTNYFFSFSAIWLVCELHKALYDYCPCVQEHLKKLTRVLFCRRCVCNINKFIKVEEKWIAMFSVRIKETFAHGWRNASLF